jgi:hypothetical protein
MNSRSPSPCFRSTNLLRWVISLLLLPAATASGIAHARDTWQIDPKDSIATLSLGSGADMLQIGLARASGQVAFEASDPSDPTVTFNVNSNEQRAEYASMSFSSRRCAMTADGKLIVIGDLSVTSVERSPGPGQQSPHLEMVRNVRHGNRLCSPGAGSELSGRMV